MEKEARIEIQGIVQGIGFRKRIKKQAKSLSIKGIVINLNSGTILIVAQGKDNNIEEFISWLNLSPGLARIKNIEVVKNDIIKRYYGFKIIREGNFFNDKIKSIIRLMKQIFKKEDRINNIPSHVAIIPDGNRRWARYRNLEPHFGHYKSGSYTNIESLIIEAKKLGMKYLSIWGFSTENWKRSNEEKKAIFSMIKEGIEKFSKESEKNRIRFIHIGRKDKLPKELIKNLGILENKTKHYRELTILLCLDYGGRDEIIRTINKIIGFGRKKINEKDFLEMLDTKGIPDPDLIIRTSGEKRISGFMPFQSVYSELYFTNVFFPEFSSEEFRKAIKEYSNRKRRFGGS